MDEPVTTPAEPTSEESFINPDGTWKEGWKEAYVPEDLRSEKFYDSPFAANLKELVKTAGNQAKALGKKGVIPLNDKSTDFEVQEWRKAHGVPDKYNYQKPTDLEMIEISDEWVNRAMENMNKANLSQGQFDLVMGSIHDFLKTTESEYNKSEQEEISNINRQILSEENTQYETNNQYIDKAVRQFTEGWSEEDKLKLFGTAESKGGINSKDHIELKPLMRKFLANIGKSIGEHRMVVGEVGGRSLQEQLDEARKDPNFIGGFGKPHNDAVEKVNKLTQQLNAQLGKAQYM